MALVVVFFVKFDVIEILFCGLVLFAIEEIFFGIDVVLCWVPIEGLKIVGELFLI
jgi:hypothetical protein